MCYGSLPGFDDVVSPLDRSVRVMFSFPDGQLPLDRIDQPLAGRKSRNSMRRGDPHPNRTIADAERPDPVSRADRDHVEIGQRTRLKVLPGGLHYVAVRAVFESQDGPARMMITHRAFEDDYCSGFTPFQRLSQ